MILSLVFNLVISITARRIPETTTTIAVLSGTTTSQQQHNQDMRLLKHTLFMFTVFILGWASPFVILDLPNTIYYTIPGWIISS